MDNMIRYNHSKEKQDRESGFSLDKNDEGSAARTRPYSIEEIMLKRTNKEFPENLKENFNKTQKKMLKSTVEVVSDHFSSEKVCAESTNGHSASLGHLSTNTLKRSSRKKDESASMKEDYGKRSRSTEDKDSKPKRNEAEKKIYGKRKHDNVSDNDFKCGHHAKDTKYSQIKGKHEVRGRENFERERKEKQDVEGNDNYKEGFVETKHEKHRKDMRKCNRDASNDNVKETKRKHSRHSAGKNRYSDRSRGERENDREYENLNDKRLDVNAARKNNFNYHHESEILERKERDERVKSNYEESGMKRGRLRSRQLDERRKRSPSVSPTAHSYPVEELKESLSQYLKDKPRKQQSNTDRDRSPTNGSSSHHRKHEEPSSKFGGYMRRKRKPEASAKTLSPSRNSQKRIVGWDLPPQGTESVLSALVPSNLLSSHLPSSNPQQLTSANIDSALLKSLPVKFVSILPKGINASADSVQLTQATRPMRRLHLENLPPSASEEAVLDCLNGFLLSTGINHVQGAQPCIGCTIHKEKGQALVEFLTPEDASSALSFDGSTILGSIVKIRRPKDYVEVANGDSERSTEAAITVSDVVQDSPDKVFIGGISKDLSPEMLLEVASAFGSLKAFHFEANNSDGPCAFMEYIDRSVTAKACSGLNGMKLAGKMLTVVQAMPNMSSSENDGRRPCYNVPELAKPLLKEPTQVLKLSNVFKAEALSSVTEEEIQKVMEDIRLECARFGTVKSINVVKHVDQMDHVANSEIHVVNDVGMTGASLTSPCGEKSAQSSCIEPKTDQESRNISQQEALCDAYHIEDQMAVEDTVNEKTQDGAPCVADHLEDHIAVEETANENSQDEAQCDADNPDDHMVVEDTVKVKTQDGNLHKNLDDKLEMTEKEVSDVIGVDHGKTMEALDEFNLIRDSDLQHCSTYNTSRESASVEKQSKLDANHEIVFELGSVLVEYKRTEASRMAAHCLHGRSFDHSIVMVEYVPFHVYRARFTN